MRRNSLQLSRRIQGSEHVSGTHEIKSFENSKKDYETSYLILAEAIIKAYLETKHQTKEKNPFCLQILKKTIPFEEDDEKTTKTDPLILFGYLKLIFDKNFELKFEAENEIADKRQSGIDDYEVMLQKLEAEVRQHIRIEQQLKLYVEATQARLDEVEHNNNTSLQEELKKTIEDLQKDNYTLKEKLKKRGNDIDNYLKDLASKNAIIKKLEHQVESIPFLKNRIREIESVINNEAFKSHGSSALRSHNKTSKDFESYMKALGISNNGSMNEGKSRKNSQPFLGIQSQEILKKKTYDKEKDKENMAFLRNELLNDIHKLQFESHRLINEHSSNEKTELVSKGEKSGSKTSRKIERIEDHKILGKAKKYLRSDNSHKILREKNKNFDLDSYIDRSLSNLRNKEIRNGADMVEPSKFYSSRLSIGVEQMIDSQRRLMDKRRHSKSKPELKENSETMNLSNSKNKIPKSSRPSTSHDKQLNYADYQKLKRDSEIQDISRTKVTSPYKKFQERSNSVDNKTKLYNELKSRGERGDRLLDEKRRKSAYNIQNKNNLTFNTHKVNGIF